MLHSRAAKILSAATMLLCSVGAGADDEAAATAEPVPTSDRDFGHVDFSVDGATEVAATDRDYGHVNFAVDETTEVAGTDRGDGDVDVAIEETGPAGDDKGQGHVDFGIEGEGSTDGGVKGQGHVDFCIDGSEDAAGGERGQGHVDFAVDPAGAYAVLAEVVPGECGAEVCGLADQSAAFFVAIRPDGTVDVNGQVVGTGDPSGPCRITVSWAAGTGYVAIRVEDAAGVVCDGQWPMATAPNEVHVRAAEITFLTVTPQQG